MKRHNCGEWERAVTTEAPEGYDSVIQLTEDFVIDFGDIVVDDQAYTPTVTVENSGKNLKPRYDLVPANGLRAAARAMGAGSAKYGNQVQRKTVDEHYRGVLSHLMAWRLGEAADPETGLSHLDHASARMALLVFEVEALDK